MEDSGHAAFALSVDIEVVVVRALVGVRIQGRKLTVERNELVLGPVFLKRYLEVHLVFGVLGNFHLRLIDGSCLILNCWNEIRKVSWSIVVKNVLAICVLALHVWDLRSELIQLGVLLPEVNAVVHWPRYLVVAPCYQLLFVYYLLVFFFVTWAVEVSETVFGVMNLMSHRNSCWVYSVWILLVGELEVVNLMKFSKALRPLIQRHWVVDCCIMRG
jgi:hypothetical protein